MEQKENPNYYGIIPADVRYDKTLSPYAKLIYSELTCLTNKEGYCFSSNGYFADLYGVTDQAVSKWINSLSEKGYVRLEYITNKETKQVLQRRIYITKKVTEVSKNNSTSDEVSTIVNGVSTYDEECINTGLTGYQHTIKYNNTSNNNTSNNITSSSEEEKTKIKPETSKDEKKSTLTSQYKEIEKEYFDVWNKLYSEHKVATEKPIIDYRIIRSREKSLLSGGLTKDQLKNAIDAAVSDSFVMSGGFSLSVILSGTVINRLINGSKPSSDNDSVFGNNNPFELSDRHNRCASIDRSQEPGYWEDVMSMSFEERLKKAESSDNYFKGA